MVPIPCVREDCATGDDEHSASGKIREEEQQVHRFMDWWERGFGEAAASERPLLAAVDTGLLAELIAAGGCYHTILTADKLDGLHRRYGAGTEPALDPLRRALQSRGGAKSQARAVGMLLFKEARAAFESGGDCTIDPGDRAVSAPAAAADAGAGGAAAPTPVVMKPAPMPEKAPPPTAVPSATTPARGAALDEVWKPARRYVCSPNFPAGAQIAARAQPNREGELLTTFPEGTDFLVTGRRGDYLQVHFQDDVGKTATAYVPRAIGDLELLVPVTPVQTQSPAPMPTAAAPLQQQAPIPAEAEAMALSTSTEAFESGVDSTVAAPPPAALSSPAKLSTATAQGALQDSPQKPQLPSKTCEAARLEALEARVAQQDGLIHALQIEIAGLRAHLGAAAAALSPVNVASVR